MNIYKKGREHKNICDALGSLVPHGQVGYYMSTFICKCFILCIDSLALKSKRNGQNPVSGYPSCAYI